MKTKLVIVFKQKEMSVIPRHAKNALRQNGYVCKVCGFDSGAIYCEDFKNRIEVHHIIPVSERNERYVIDYKNHLIPVCPSCHMILHLKNADGKTLTWQELRDIVQSRRREQ